MDDSVSCSALFVGGFATKLCRLDRAARPERPCAHCTVLTAMRVVSATVMLVIVLATASGSQALAEVPSNVLAPALRGGDGAQDLVPRDWLQASSLLQAGAGAGAEVDPCQVCTYVLENKGVNQPYLCRGLKDPASQKMVSGEWMPRGSVRACEPVSSRES